MAQNDAVKFVFIPVGEPIPEQKEEGTIYFCAEGQKLYVGDNLIANAGGGGSGDIDIEINGEGDYIASAGFSNNVLTLTKSSLYDAVDNAGFVSEEYVDDAISSATADLLSHGDLSGYASEGYVDDAISQYLSFVDIAKGSPDDNRYITSVNKSSTVDGQLDVYYRSFGSIASDDVDLVTGSVVYSAISSFISGINIDLAEGSNNGRYLCEFDSDSNATTIRGLYRNFGTVTSDGADLVTGSAVYSGIRDALADAASYQSISSRTIGDTFLYTMHIPSHAADNYVLYEAPIGQVTSSEQFFVPGSAIYSAISELASEGYVDNAITSIYSMLGSDYATLVYVNSVISNAISNVDSSIGDAINYLLGDSSPLLEESGIMNSVIDSFNLASESYVQSYTQDYLSSIITYGKSWDYVNIERDNNTLVYTFNPATFGPIASDAHHAVAGSTIYSAIAAIPTIPSYSATDEGKVLKIVNGEPAWVSI